MRAGRSNPRPPLSSFRPSFDGGRRNSATTSLSSAAAALSNPSDVDVEKVPETNRNGIEFLLKINFVYFQFSVSQFP